MFVTVMLAAPSLAAAHGSDAHHHAVASTARHAPADRRPARRIASRHAARHSRVTETAFIDDNADVSDDADAGAGSGPVIQTGVASWYGGNRWNGNRTASGETYADDDLTAAHATLPIGARVRVTTLDTGRSVVVRINDRIGTRRRILDLSRAAAEKLHMTNRGVAEVSIARVD